MVIVKAVSVSRMAANARLVIVEIPGVVVHPLLGFGLSLGTPNNRSLARCSFVGKSASVQNTS
jgi:hypothetical protein